MASIFNALNIGYSGLNAAQVGIDTTGHNIANAETEGYSRQRVVTSEAYPVGIEPGLRGNGTQISEIVRIFDSFVFNRYSATAQSKENSDTLKKNLEELSTYFPDIENVGIKNDLQSYFDSWQSLASNPSNVAVKVALGQQAQILTQHINQTRSQVAALQVSMNDQIKSNIDEVNRIAKHIAELNKSIDVAEASGTNNANDLRDQRSQLELTLSKLIGTKVFAGYIQTNNVVDTNIATKDGNYSIMLHGFNLVDGPNFHPIGTDNTKNPAGFYDLYYERQDGVRIPLAESITEGKIGALLELRGSKMDGNGELQNGFLQETINNLDAFAKGLIEATNNIYAQTAATRMESNPMQFDQKTSLLSSGQNFTPGTFDVVVYDINGKEIARRSINVDTFTSMDDGTPSSVVAQISAQKDDNGDNNALNDVDDILSPMYTVPSNVFSLSLKTGWQEKGYTFSIEDQGTNFAGVSGLNRFLDGNSAKNIALASNLANDVSLIRAYKSPAVGDNQTALDMVQVQFSTLTFRSGFDTSTNTIYGYFDTLATRVGTRTNSVVLSNDTITAQFNAIKQEQDSISKVSVDEEMANLIRYQTSYGAAAKVITTIDQMMTTLLGLKQ